MTFRTDRIKADKVEKIFNAVLLHDYTTLKRYFRYGGSPDLIDGRGWSMLCFAARNTNEAMVKFLLEKGATVNLKSTPWHVTPLHCAAYNGNGNSAEVISVLIEAAARR